MSATTTMPQIPFQAPIADKTGKLTPVWSDWFKQALVRMGGNIALPSAQSFPFAYLTSTDWSNSLGASGYQKLGSGLYIQWGVTGSLSSNTQTAITFPIAFPSACFQVVAGIQGNSSGSTTATGQWGTGSYSKTGFNLNNQTSAAYTFNYLAVGN